MHGRSHADNSHRIPASRVAAIFAERTTSTSTAAPDAALDAAAIDAAVYAALDATLSSVAASVAAAASHAATSVSNASASAASAAATLAATPTAIAAAKWVPRVERDGTAEQVLVETAGGGDLSMRDQELDEADPGA